MAFVAIECAAKGEVVVEIDRVKACIAVGVSGLADGKAK
jgi:hypothetical protein